MNNHGLESTGFAYLSYLPHQNPITAEPTESRFGTLHYFGIDLIWLWFQLQRGAFYQERGSVCWTSNCFFPYCLCSGYLGSFYHLVAAVLEVAPILL